MSDFLGDKGASAGIPANTCRLDHASVMLVVLDGLDTLLNLKCILDKLQIDHTLEKQVEEILFQLQQEEGSSAQAMALGLQQISGFLKVEAR